MKITSSAGGVFYPTLKAKVNDYFLKRKRTGNIILFVKATVIILSALSMNIVPYMVHFGLGLYLLLSVKKGFMMAFAGFNIGHDAIHGSFSQKGWVNTSMGYVFDFSGVSSWYWHHKHNIMHHSYTNTEDDDDLESAKLLRLAPWQQWYPIHRFQHIYSFGLYGLEHVYWALWNDFKKYFTHKIGDHKITEKMKFHDHCIFWLGKIIYIGKSIVLPIVLLGVVKGLLGFIVMEYICGWTLSCVFQMAHVQNKSQFFRPDPVTGIIDMEWAIEQVKTTADFATKNYFITSHLGGLNFQTIHHLFPKVSHVHYPALQNIVIETCNEFKIEYNHYDSIIDSFRDHFSYLKKAGSKPDLKIA